MCELQDLQAATDSGAREFAIKLATYNPNKDSDKDLFAEIVRRSVEQWGVGREFLADRFAVSLATISRWSTRRARPTAFVRRAVVETIREEILARVGCPDGGVELDADSEAWPEETLHKAATSATSD